MQYVRMFVSSSVIALLIICQGQAQNKFVGVKTCGMCHKSEKQGNQLSIWQKSKHAEAFKTLTSTRADSIAKAKGLKNPAAQSAECLQCHVSGHDMAANLIDKSFDEKDGVQCETCHGAGSGYKTITIMKDTAKAIAAGLRFPKSDAEIEKLCRTCHNDKSPMYKAFKFEEMWAKIKHPKPKT